MMSRTSAGRYGNRIGKGKFSIDVKEHHLIINDGENHPCEGTKVFFKTV